MSWSERLTFQLLLESTPTPAPTSLDSARGLGWNPGASISLPFSALLVQPTCKSHWLRDFTLTRTQLLPTARAAAPLLSLETETASEPVLTSARGPHACSPHSQGDLPESSILCLPAQNLLLAHPAKRSLDNGRRGPSDLAQLPLSATNSPAH